MIMDFPAVHPLHPNVGDIVHDLHSTLPIDMVVAEIDTLGSGVVCEWSVGRHDQKVWFALDALRVVRRAPR